MKRSKAPQSEQGRDISEELKEQLEELTLSIFQLSLAHRLIHDIMRDGLMTNVYDNYVDLNRVLMLLSTMDSILRKLSIWLHTGELAVFHVEPDESSSGPASGTSRPSP